MRRTTITLGQLIISLMHSSEIEHLKQLEQVKHSLIRAFDDFAQTLLSTFNRVYKDELIHNERVNLKDWLFLQCVFKTVSYNWKNDC